MVEDVCGQCGVLGLWVVLVTSGSGIRRMQLDSGSESYRKGNQQGCCALTERPAAEGRDSTANHRHGCELPVAAADKRLVAKGARLAAPDCRSICSS